jgi:hypothetical protein
MVPISNPTETWRKNFRSIVLLAILGVCATAAWVLAWHKSAPAREAQEILAEIRRNGIKSYWPDDAIRQQWFFVYRGDNVVGWEKEYHQAGSDHIAGCVEKRWNNDKGQVRISSRWRLSNNAEEGEYQSKYEIFSSPHPIFETIIVLRNRNLQVFQNIKGAHFTSTRKIPENYLPEGLSSLVIREVARRRGHGRFEMVLDDIHPEQLQGGQTPLFPMELRYVGVDPDTGGAKIEESLDPKNSWTIVLDAAGNVLRRDQGNTRTMPVSYETVLKKFPAAAEFADKETGEL